LRAWSLAAAPAGRVGGVRLELFAPDSETVLGHCYQQVPLRVLPPFHVGRERAALVYLINPTAGLLDGDAQLIDITARPGSRAMITGQSATRIHPCLDGFSTQQWRLRVEAGAVLVMLPGPAIPFRGARYYQRVEIELAEGGCLVWGDIWLAGRYARGAESEQFQFEMLIQELTVRRDHWLVFRDRFCWCGPWDEDAVSWHFGPGLACGNVFVSGQLPESILERPGDPPSCVSATAAGDTCLRWCGEPEQVIAAVVQTALLSGSVLSGKQTMEPWLLGSHELAPNHWFQPTPADTL
jgi:urease accessory protein